MDDQFGGRTDDDLFADEFEPVEDQYGGAPPPAEPASAPAPVPAAAAPAAVPAPSTTTTTTSSSSPQPPAPEMQQPPNIQTANAPPPTSSVTSPKGAPKGLLQSRHATQAPPPSTPRAPRNHKPNHTHNNNANNNNSSSNNNSNDVDSTSTPKPSSPASHPAKADHNPNNNTERRRHGSKPGSDARMSSGSNPRTKPTEDELAEKMRKMTVLNAERAAKFKQQEQDRQSHEIAVEKATEDAKKRRAEEAERRKREAVDRRQMDDERERNRERKLKAMEAKAGGSWDEGKEERAVEEEKRRGGYNFRGANGGVRSSAPNRGGGLSGSRFAATDDTDFMTSGRGGRGRERGGRGRGGRGGGGGGRGGFSAREDDFDASPQQAGPPPAGRSKEPVLKTEDFPALPGSSAPKEKKTENTIKADLASPLSPLGKWDEEMESQDEKNAAAQS